ncbi:MAG: hypothetical protein E7641_07685 [Ruminococcaceae bacterium]|nr:hypothetical protein [Oscillospiraceae bacterium]
MNDKEKSFKILDSVGGVKESYLAESDPKRASGHGRTGRRLLAIAACVALLLTSLSLWLFIPYSNDPPSVKEYSDSEYYPLIQKINCLTFTPNRFRNNFEMLTANIGGFKDEDIRYGADAESGDSESDTGIDYILSGNPESATGTPTTTGTYVEATDNQVAGVIEGDIIKRSDKHIFYMNGSTLNVYTIEGEDSKLLSRHTVHHGDGSYSGCNSPDFYLSEDCRRVTVIDKRYLGMNSYLSVISLDVSDPENIKEIQRISISGSKISSRLVDGKLLLISYFHINKRGLDFSDESTFLPQIDVGNGFESLRPDKIFSPDDPSSLGYTVVTKIDEQTLTLEDSAAFLSYSSSVYVSLDSVYITRGYVDSDDQPLFENSFPKMSEISRLRYSGDKLEYLGSATIEGRIKDQYSLDEKDGILRVVTTTESLIRMAHDGEYFSYAVPDLVGKPSESSANLYCIDLATMKTVATVEQFAPLGEAVRSVRFDGNTAYVCTSVALSDPVFFFDLTDISNITYKHTGTIDGFSSSLVDLNDGYLLGIGVGSSRSVAKIEIYEEGEEKVIPLCKFETAGYIADAYKSYLIDRDNSLVGVAVTDNTHSTVKINYYLLHFNGSRLTKLAEIPLPSSIDTRSTRAQVIDGYLYLLTEGNVFKVEDITK